MVRYFHQHRGRTFDPQRHAVIVHRHKARATGPDHAEENTFPDAHFRQAMRETLAAIDAMHEALFAGFEKFQGTMWDKSSLLGD